MRGLEVTFHKPLCKTQSGVSPSGGAVFHFEYMQEYDLKNSSLVLRPDYEALISLRDEVVVFQSDAPNTPRMFVQKSLVASIRDLASNKILY